MSRRGALIGFGTIAQGHLEGYRRFGNLTIAAVVDESPERRALAERALPEANVFTTIDQALAMENLDFVDVCTAPSSHLAIMTMALAKNLHVLCEKPLVIGASSIPVLLEALANSKATLYPCHNYKFAPAVRTMRENYVTKLGRLTSGQFRIVRTGHARGVLEWRENWRRDCSISGGGILYDHGPHCIYLACYLFGATATGVSCNLVYPEKGSWMTTEEAATLNLYFEEVSVRIDLTWVGTRRHTSYVVTGERGFVRLDGDDIQGSVDGVMHELSITSEFDDPSHGAWFCELLADFDQRIDRPDGTSDVIEDSLATIRVIEAAYESAASGGTIIALTPHEAMNLSNRKGLIVPPGTGAGK